MTSMRALVAAAGAVAVVIPMATPAMAADDGIDAWDLYYHRDTAILGEPITMFECWAEGYGSNPRLLQKVGKRWVGLATSTVTRDVGKCGSKGPIKAVYTFTIKDSLRWNAKEKSFEAVVKTDCSNCKTYDWTILVDK